MSLVATNVKISLGSRTLLEAVDLELAPATLTFLGGRNGSGKSTLLAILAGVRLPDAGAVTLDGRPLRTLAPRDRALQIALVPQDTDAPFEFTGRELVLMGRHPHMPRFGSPRPTDFEAVDRALQDVDALAFADRPVTTLSGGERRRIGLARALATGARVLLADEPTANLDLDHALSTLRLLQHLAHGGRTVLLVSHDISLTAAYCDHAALLHHGRIRCHGPTESVLTPPVIEEVFGVRCASGHFPRGFAPR